MLGGYSALTVLVNAASVDAVVVSARTLTPERMNNLEVLCREHHVDLSRLRVGFEPLVESARDGEADIRVRPERPLRSVESSRS